MFAPNQPVDWVECSRELLAVWEISEVSCDRRSILDSLLQCVNRAIVQDWGQGLLQSEEMTLIVPQQVKQTWFGVMVGIINGYLQTDQLLPALIALNWFREVIKVEVWKFYALLRIEFNSKFQSIAQILCVLKIALYHLFSVSFKSGWVISAHVSSQLYWRVFYLRVRYSQLPAVFRNCLLLWSSITGWADGEQKLMYFFRWLQW